MRCFQRYFAILACLCLANLRAQGPDRPRAIVEGDIINAVTGAPIPGARVKIAESQEEPLYARADRRGHFRFENLPPAGYVVNVNVPGFLSPMYTQVDFSRHEIQAFAETRLPRATVTTTADPDGTLHARIAFPLLAQAVITGKVTDADGDPLDNCTVEIFRKEPLLESDKPGPLTLPDARYNLIPVKNLHTNDKGEFRAAGLEPGVLYLRAGPVSSPGTWLGTYRLTYFPRTLDVASAKPLQLAPGEQARADIQILRQSGIRVSGRILQPESGQPSDSLLVTQIILRPENSDALYSESQSTSGRDDYKLDDVLPGKYILLAATQNVSTPVEQKMVAGLMRSFEAGDRDMSGVDLVMQPLRDLQGAVTFPDGCAPFPVTIRAQSTSGRNFGNPEAVSGADGKFVLSAVRPGHFRISVSGPDGPVSLASVRLGHRDIQQDGFNAPLHEDEPLVIEIACGGFRRLP